MGKKKQEEITTLKKLDVLQVFIGYDTRQPVAFNVLSHSIWKRASRPVSITRLSLSTLPIKRRGLTEFTYSRFLVPFLSDFDGYSLFIDSDSICLTDIYDLLKFIILKPDADVYLVKNPKLKFEWASVMLFNNSKCRILTPDFIDNNANVLFDFAWTDNIQELPPDWNHLVHYDSPRNDAKLVHFTQGIPCWRETLNSEYTIEWTREFKEMNSTVSFDELMGNSVHAKFVHNRLNSQ
jgi:hypothetical protein